MSSQKNLQGNQYQAQTNSSQQQQQYAPIQSQRQEASHLPQSQLKSTSLTNNQQTSFQNQTFLPQNQKPTNNQQQINQQSTQARSQMNPPTFTNISQSSFYSDTKMQEQMILVDYQHFLQFATKQQEKVYTTLYQKVLLIQTTEEATIDERKNHQVEVQRLVEVIEFQKKNLAIQTQFHQEEDNPAHQFDYDNHYSQKLNLVDYRQRKYITLKNEHNVNNQNHQSEEVELSVLKLKDLVTIQVQDALSYIQSSRALKLSQDKDIADNLKRLMDLINKVGDMRKQQAQTVSPEEKRKIIANLKLFEAEYQANIQQKEMIDISVAQIQKSSFNLEEMIRISSSFLQIFDEFKNINDYFQSQKYKMEDYLELFERLLEDNVDTIQEFLSQEK